MLLELETKNPAFTTYLGRRYSEDRFYGVPQKSLPADLANELSLIYSSISDGKDLAADAVTVGFTVKNGVFGRLYGPTVYHRVVAEKPELVIKWGDQFIPFSVNQKGTIVWRFPADWVKFPDTEFQAGEKLEVTACFADAEANGYKAVCVQIEATRVDLSDEEKVIATTILNIPIRFAGDDRDKYPNATTLKTLFKTNPDEAFSLISEPQGTSNFVKAYDLHVGRYEIAGLNKFKGKKDPTKVSIAVHLISGESIWLPGGMVDDIVDLPDSIKGWLTITKANPKEFEVEGSIALGESAWPFKLDPPTQHLRHLGIGEYVLEDYYLPANSTYGTFILVIKDKGRFYCPNGTPTALLQSSPIITKQNPALLIIDSCTEKLPGKWSIGASIILPSSDDEEMLDLL